MTLPKIFKIVLYLLAVFLFQELVFRYVYPIPEIENFDRVNFTHLSFEGDGSKHSRDRIWEWRSDLDTSHVFKHQMNRYGFRDTEWTISSSKGKKRALFIGDSFVEGVMATQEETIPLAFQNASKGTFEAFNGGLLGCGLSAYLQLAADAIPVFKPDVAILCIYANDLGNAPPQVPEFYLEPKMFDSKTPRLLEVLSQIQTYGPLNHRWANVSAPYLPAIPNKRNPWTTLEDSLKQHVKPTIAESMKQALLNPFLTNAIVKEEHALKVNPNLGETLPFFKYICETNGTQPVIVYIPSRNQVSDYYLPFERQYALSFPDTLSLKDSKYQRHQEVIKSQAKALDLQFIDLTPTIQDEESHNVHLYWHYDQHMKAKGYELIGTTIWNRLNQH